MFVPSRGGPTGVKVTVEELLGGDAAAQRRNKEAEIPAAGLHGVFQPDESRRSGGGGGRQEQTKDQGVGGHANTQTTSTRTERGANRVETLSETFILWYSLFHSSVALL